MIVIIIRINDRVTLEEYHDVADEIIIGDFLEYPFPWLLHPETEIEIKEVKP